MSLLNVILASNLVKVDNELLPIPQILTLQADTLKKMVNSGLSAEEALEKIHSDRFAIVLKSKKANVTFYNLMNARILGGNELGSFLVYSNDCNGGQGHVTVTFYRMEQVLDDAVPVSSVSELDIASLHIARKIEAMRQTHQKEHPDCPRDRWKQAVADDETQLGYWEYALLVTR